MLSQKHDSEKGMQGRHLRIQTLSQDRGRGPGALQPGDPAPDFRLKRRGSQEWVALSSFKGTRPVALIFGSFT